MANKTISELAELQTANQDAEIAVFKNGKTHRLTLNDLRDHFVGDFFTRMTKIENERANNKTVPVGTSYMLFSQLNTDNNDTLINNQTKFYPPGSGLTLSYRQNRAIKITNNSQNNYIIGMSLHGMSNTEASSSSLVSIYKSVQGIAGNNIFTCTGKYPPASLDIQCLSTQIITFKLNKNSNQQIFFSGADKVQKTTFETCNTATGDQTVKDYIAVSARWRFITIKAIKI